MRTLLNCPFRLSYDFTDDVAEMEAAALYDKDDDEAA
jgi:hypothetical protein